MINLSIRRCPVPNAVVTSIVTGIFINSFGLAVAGDFGRDVRPVLTKYCFECHSGDETNGDVDFGSVASQQDIDEAFELWESMVENLRSHSMPPEDSPQPTTDERDQIEHWYKTFVESIEPRPAVFQPRRLSVTEYRNTLRSVLGFDLEVDVIEAEQTVTERSMVIKLLPEDPPGKSGFKNDTHENPLSTVAWDQYSYLVSAALEELFSEQRREEMQKFTGPIRGQHLKPLQAERLVRLFVPLAMRRDVGEAELTKINERLGGKFGSALESALRLELETVLMSPGFIYRGLRMPRGELGQQPVDRFELAERLSYFLWADMPDQELMDLAATAALNDPQIYSAQIDRLLASPKARSLSEVFVTEWLSLGEIENVSDNPPEMLALKTQPIDFTQYLFTEDRPLIELIDSRTAFVNRFTAKMYGEDSKQIAESHKRTWHRAKNLAQSPNRVEAFHISRRDFDDARRIVNEQGTDPSRNVGAGADPRAGASRSTGECRPSGAQQTWSETDVSPAFRTTSKQHQLRGLP